MTVVKKLVDVAHTNTVDKVYIFVIFPTEVTKQKTPNMNERKRTSNQGNKIIPNCQYYQEKDALVKKWKIKLKINTVTNKTNYRDYSLTPFIISL